MKKSSEDPDEMLHHERDISSGYTLFAEIKTTLHGRNASEFNTNGHSITCKGGNADKIF